MIYDADAAVVYLRGLAAGEEFRGFPQCSKNLYQISDILEEMIIALRPFADFAEHIRQLEEQKNQSVISVDMSLGLIRDEGEILDEWPENFRRAAKSLCSSRDKALGLDDAEYGMTP